MKLIIASIVILSAVVLFLFALFPSDISVTRLVQTTIPRDSLYRQVADLRNWSRWNRLAGETSLRSGGGADSLGDDKLTVTVIRRSRDSVLTVWRSRKGKSFTGLFYLTGDSAQTILEWKLQFHLNWYPWEKLSGMMYEKQLGSAMDSSLLNLTQRPALR